MDPRNTIDLIRTNPLWTSDVEGAPIPDDYLLYERFGGSYYRYWEALQDGHFVSRANTRLRAILGRGVRVEPASPRRADRKAAEGIASMLKARPARSGDHYLLMPQNKNKATKVSRFKVPYDTITYMLSWGIPFGHAILLNDLRVVDGLIMPYNFRAVERDRTYFYPEGRSDAAYTITNEVLKPDEILTSAGYEIRVKTMRAQWRGERIPVGRGVHFSYGSPNMNPWGIGLISQCWRWIAIKKQAPKELLLHAMKGGSPGITGYSPLANDVTPEGIAAKNAILAFMQALSPGAYYLKTAADEEVDVLASAIPPDIHEMLINISNREISEVIVGDQSYAEKSHGSRAAGESQVEDRNLTITDSDCSLIDESLQTMWDYISLLNWPNANPPQVRRETYAERIEREEEAKAEERRNQARAQRIEGDRSLIVDMGARPTNEYIEEHYPGWTFDYDPLTLNNATGEGTEEPEGAPEFGEGKYGHINFKPPPSVVTAFKRAIAAHKAGRIKTGPGMEAATKTWAAKFARGEKASPDKVRKGYRFFKRNARFEKMAKDTPAWGAWAFWGYGAGRGWFNKLYRQMAAADGIKMGESDPWEGSTVDFAGAGRYVYWQGFKIGIEHEVGSERFGRVMKVAYGYFTKLKGADGEALDVYLGPYFSSDKIFKIFQPKVEITTGDDGENRFRVLKNDAGEPELDEYKYMIFFETAEQAARAFKAQMPSAFFGSIEEVTLADVTASYQEWNFEELKDDGLLRRKDLNLDIDDLIDASGIQLTNGPEMLEPIAVKE